MPMFGERLLRTLVAVITKARYFSLLADEASDVKLGKCPYVFCCVLRICCYLSRIYM